MSIKNSFYKVSMIIEIILIIITLFLCYYAPSINNNFIEIPYLHPNEFYVVLLSSSILLIISALVALIISLFIKQKEKATSEAESKKVMQSVKFWQLTFFSNVIITFLVICFTIYTFITVESSMIFYQIHLFKSSILLIILIQLAVSLFLGAIFLSSSVLWQQNKTMAKIIVFVGFCLFLIPFGYISYITSRIYHDQINADYYLETGDAAEEVYDESYEEAYDEGEEYEEGDSEDYVSFSNLWDDPSEDEDNMISVINMFANIFTQSEGNNSLGDMRYLYDPRSDIDEKNTPTYYFNRIKHKILENPDMLQSAFETYKSTLYTIIPTKTYIRNDGDVIIELLLLSYYDIQSDGDPAATLKNIHRIMTSRPKNEYNYDDDATDFYDEIKVHVSEKMMEKYNTLKYSMKYNVSEGDIVWAYSFWARRNKEGTTKGVLNILNDVKDYYNE